MNRFKQSQRAEIHLDDLDKPGPELIDDLSAFIGTERLLGDMVSPDGVAMSLLHGRDGQQIDGVGEFQPGVDAPNNLDMRATYASGRPHARKTLSLGSPAKLHVVLDMPERTAMLEGKHSYESIGNYVLALSSVIGEVIGDAEIRVYHSSARSSDGVVWEGAPEDAYAAFSSIDADKNLTGGGDTDFSDLLDAANGSIDSDNEAAIVLSDFMEGYNLSTGRFNWETPLSTLANNQEGLLWVNRAVSKSHDRLPYGLVKGLDYRTVQKMNQEYSEIAQAKQARIRQVLDTTTEKVSIIDLNQPNPAEMIIKSLAGNSLE